MRLPDAAASSAVVAAAANLIQRNGQEKCAAGDDVQGAAQRARLGTRGDGGWLAHAASQLLILSSSPTAAAHPVAHHPPTPTDSRIHLQPPHHLPGAPKGGPIDVVWSGTRHHRKSARGQHCAGSSAGQRQHGRHILRPAIEGAAGQGGPVAVAVRRLVGQLGSPTGLRLQPSNPPTPKTEGNLNSAM